MGAVAGQPLQPEFEIPELTGFQCCCYECLVFPGTISKLIRAVAGSGFEVCEIVFDLRSLEDVLNSSLFVQRQVREVNDFAAEPGRDVKRHETPRNKIRRVSRCGTQGLLDHAL